MRDLDDDDRPLNAEAVAILRHATVADLKADADELAKLAQAVQRPIPLLPDCPREKELALLCLLLRSREHARQLLAVVERLVG